VQLAYSNCSWPDFTR